MLRRWGRLRISEERARGHPFAIWYEFDARETAWQSVVTTSVRAPGFAVRTGLRAQARTHIPEGVRTLYCSSAHEYWWVITKSIWLHSAALRVQMPSSRLAPLHFNQHF